MTHSDRETVERFIEWHDRYKLAAAKGADESYAHLQNDQSPSPNEVVAALARMVIGNAERTNGDEAPTGEAERRILVDRCRTHNGIDYWRGTWRREGEQPHHHAVSSHGYVLADVHDSVSAELEVERALSAEMYAALRLVARLSGEGIVRQPPDAARVIDNAIAKAEAREKPDG